MDHDCSSTCAQVAQPAPRNRARLTNAISLLVLAGALVWVAVSTARDVARPPAAQVQVGAPAPEFTLTTLDGKTVRLADYRGRPLVLNFFASWCDPCREEAPVVEAMAREAGAQGYAVLGVAVQDERQALTAFMQEEGLTLPAALDRDDKVARAYRLIGPPTTFFIDAGGVLRHQIVGPLTPARVSEGLEKARQGAATAARETASMAASAPGIAIAVGAGLLSFLSPCCLPLLPAFMGYITGVSAEELRRRDDTRARRRQALGRTGAFALGLVLVFTLMGASASLFGGWLTEYRSITARAAGLLVLAFGLHMAGLLYLPFLQREYRPGLAARPPGEGRGTLSAMGLGAAFGLGWTPCVGPMLGSILLLAAQEATLWRGMLLLIAYGLGLGLPFVLTGLAADRVLGAMASWRRHMGRIEKVGGALLISMGVLLVLDMLSSVALWFNRVL